MFITWLAFSLPLVSATMLHGFADDVLGFIDDAQPVRFRVKYDYNQPAGWGLTDEFGNISISPHGTRTDRLRALYHEQVHAFLTPKGRFQSFRHVTLGAYTYSHLWRYTEEAIAESRAQRLTGGKLITGLVFPIAEHYVNPAVPTGRSKLSKLRLHCTRYAIISTARLKPQGLAAFRQR